MNVCIIPARGGSKRIPSKNIKPFHGKPIIAYSIQAALDSECFDSVIVSTDNEDIADVAIECGADVPFIRPKALADDYQGTDNVVRHAIQWCLNNDKRIERVCCLYATAPFVTPSMLQDGLALLIDTKKDYCFAATAFDFPIQRALKVTENGGIEPFDKESIEKRSQDLELAYHDAGLFYWGRAEAYLKNKNFYSDATIPLFLPTYLVQDIDTLDDWKRAELMYSLLLAGAQ